MFKAIGRFALIVHDYDEALCFYTTTLGLQTLLDYQGEDGLRLLQLGLQGQSNLGLWFFEAQTDEERALVGKQAVHQPLLVCYTENFEADYQRLKDQGIRFQDQPTHDRDAIHVHFYDLYGNEIVLVQLVKPPPE